MPKVLPGPLVYRTPAMRSRVLKRLNPKLERIVISCSSCAEKLQMDGSDAELKEHSFKQIDLGEINNRGAEGEADLIEPCVQLACLPCTILCCPCLVVCELLINVIVIVGCVVATICCIGLSACGILVSPFLCVAACCGGTSYLVHKKMDD